MHRRDRGRILKSGKEKNESKNLLKSLFTSSSLYLVVVIWALLSYKYYYIHYRINIIDYVSVSELLLIFGSDLGIIYAGCVLMSALVTVLFWSLYRRLSLFHRYSWASIILLLLLAIGITYSIYSFELNFKWTVISFAVVAVLISIINLIFYKELKLKSFIFIPVLVSLSFLFITTSKSKEIIELIDRDKYSKNRVIKMSYGEQMCIDDYKVKFVGSTQKNLFLLQKDRDEKWVLILLKSASGYSITDEIPYNN